MLDPGPEEICYVPRRAAIFWIRREMPYSGSEESYYIPDLWELGIFIQIYICIYLGFIQIWPPSYFLASTAIRIKLRRRKQISATS
jgi:hypothetical protein